MNIINLNMSLNDLRSSIKDNLEQMNNSLYQSFENLKLMINLVTDELSDADEEQKEAILKLNQRIENNINMVDNLKKNMKNNMNEKKE